MEKERIVSNEQVKLEFEIILNRKLYQYKVINKETYEMVQNELLKDVKKEIKLYEKS